MKAKQIILILMFFLVTVFLGLSPKHTKSSSSSDLKLETVANRTHWITGEKITLSLSLENSDGLLSTKSRRCGYLKLVVAGNDKIYKEAVTSGGLQLDQCEVALPLGRATKMVFERHLLWNSVPKTDHLNAESANRFLENKITSEFIFPKAGIYNVKALLTIGDEQIPPIESEPLEISVEEPEGENLTIWKSIKENGNFAYFIQEGEILIPSNKLEERAKFQSEVEDILNKYPNSLYAEPLRQSLVKFKASEAKRGELFEKMKAKKP